MRIHPLYLVSIGFAASAFVTPPLVPDGAVARAALASRAPAPLAVAAIKVEDDSISAASSVAGDITSVITSNPPVKRSKREKIKAGFRNIATSLSLAKAVKEEAEALVLDSCDVDEPEVCADENAVQAAVAQVSNVILRTLRLKRGDIEDVEAEDMEAGWQSRGKNSALKRTLEVWGFLASCGLKVVKAGKAKGTDADISAAKTAAAEFIRDGLFRLGPTFVKLGQVISTRSDVLEKEYIEVLKDLQDNVPGFGGEQAKQIIEKELGKPIDKLFDNFELEPIAAASLGQVHRATMNGKPVAIKVQRAGLKELFDTDLKNLKVLVKLLDKFDPKSDGADRSYADIYDESSKLLYEEIDYELEGKNGQRFAKELKDIGLDYVRVPDVYWEATTPRVLTMEFVPSFKLTDIARIEKEGLDRGLLAQRTADAFLTQVLKTGYFHCDPHPGNLCVDTEGNLVYYDCGMMNELQPNVAEGFKEACFAIFGGGPFITDLQLAANAKRLVDALELMGVLAKSADRLAVEKLARFFIRTFKDIQMGKKGGNIKTTLGADLQALTEQQVFRFPSTFTFIFRAFASVDGIGKGLDKAFDIPKLAQPFINELTETTAYSSDFGKWADRFGAATGLRSQDIDVAISQPKKVAYVEETIRAMEQGTLKIRVRSLENEQALGRLALQQSNTNNLLLASLLLNVGLSPLSPLPSLVWFLGAGVFGAQFGTGLLKVKLFDKKAAKYETKDFGQDA